jgi:hypothetical protein
MERREQYLGDGLYASFDGFMITLRAPREGGDHWVGLEPQIYAALVRFAKTCWGEADDRLRYLDPSGIGHMR